MLKKLYVWPIWPVNVVEVAVVSVKTGWNAPPLSETKMLYVAMPGPAASLPDHDRLMVLPAVVAGSGSPNSSVAGCRPC